MPGEKKAKAPKLNYRSAAVRTRADGPSSIDLENRSVEVVMTTETPVLVYDYDRGRINEVLLMSGAQIPESGQVVMLDAHSRYDTSYIIGSAREVRTEGAEMLGRAFFSTAPEAESPWIKTREGHLTDFSLGYRVEAAEWIPAGQERIIEGKRFMGPVQVVTKWTPRELSAVPIGADENAKARSEVNANTNHREDKKMDEHIRKALEAKGLPKDATDEEALAFMARMEVPKEHEKEETPPDLDKIRAEATGKELDRIRSIDAILQRYDCQDMARELIVPGSDGKVVTVEEAQRKVMDRIHEKAKNPGTSGVTMGRDERDKFRAAAEDALCLRGGLKVEKPVPGAMDIRGYTLAEMARECLRFAGASHFGTVKEMVGRAMTSSDFPNILANILRKSMFEGWGQAQETWQIWCGIGSVSDFKVHYDNALSEFDDLEQVNDAGEVKIGSFSERTPETYRAYTYAKKFKITRVMIINDDMGALTQMPMKRAEAANRKIGDIAYAVLTANAAMADGYSLFSSDHSNDAQSGYTGAPGIATIAAGILAMGTHKDIKGLRRLNITPQYFIAPKALQGTSEVFFTSDRFSDHSTVATDSSFASNRNNPYSGNYFTRIYEPRLDDDDVTQWYLAAMKGKTVKVVFLNGVQGPLMEMIQPGLSIEGFEYAVSVDAGAYAVDYRGLYRNEGT